MEKIHFGSKKFLKEKDEQTKEDNTPMPSLFGPKKKGYKREWNKED